jgi:hypothetical protein
MILAGSLPLGVLNLFKMKVITEIMEFSNVGSVEDDYRRLIGNLMRELPQKDANARNNGLPNHFDIEDIHTIAAFDRDFVRRCIERFQVQTHYVLLQNGRITITENGRQHFNEYRH